MNSSLRSEANAIVKRALETAIKERGEIGLQVCAYLRGALVIDTWAGVADQQTGRPVDGDTLFNVFSVTKGVALTAVHILAERGAFGYDTLVGDLWPEYATNGKEKTTIRHVLTHKAGVPQMPEGITPELMCDWLYMINFLERAKPLFEPGKHNAYHQLTYGWLLSELVRRADSKHRMIDQFVYEEIGKPLNAPDLWIGLPDSQLPRVAKLWMGDDFDWPAGSLFRVSLPLSVNLVPSIYERTDIRRAPLAGAGGIFTARSEARVWAMLANGGELDGVRLLSKERVASFSLPRENPDEPDPVFLGGSVPVGNAGYWLGSPNFPVASAKSPRALCHPGMGGSIGWADPDQNLAVAITHNRMFNARSVEDDPLLPIANVVRGSLGI
jgi:CubicO group peptidase (beta-lactamase class C family)